MTILTDDELKAVRERERECSSETCPLCDDLRALLRHADALNDQLQASQCAEAMNADVIRAQAKRIAELEAGMRQWASEDGDPLYPTDNPMKRDGA